MKVDKGRRGNYFFLFSFCVILLAFLVLVFVTNSVVDWTKNNPKITTAFNFPRYLSDSEQASPPAIRENISFFRYPQADEKENNWSEIRRNIPYDVVIIADSSLGKSPAGIYLCKKISEENNFKVLLIFTNNLEYGQGSSFRVLTYLTNNGFLRETGAKHVILGSAERMFPGAFGSVTDLNETLEIPDSLPPAQENISSTDSSLKSGSFSQLIRMHNSYYNDFSGYTEGTINNISSEMVLLKTWIKNVVLSDIGTSTVDNQFKFADLNESRFSQTWYSSRLIYYSGDIDCFHSDRYPDAVISINDKLNVISEKLRTQNISLIFIPAVSSYNTHYKYIINPPTVRNPVFEIMRTLNKSYEFIDTKEIGDRKLALGMTDLHGVADPTHWTWKFTYDIADEINFTNISKQNERPFSEDREYEYQQAAEAFRKVIYERGDTTDTWALNNDAEIYATVHDPVNASILFEKSLHIDPDQPLILKKYEDLSNRK